MATDPFVVTRQGWGRKHAVSMLPAEDEAQVGDQQGLAALVNLAAQPVVLDLTADAGVGERVIAFPLRDEPQTLVEAPTWKLATKRAMDIAGSLLLLVLLSPIMLAIALTVALSSSGGALFGQERVGRGGSRFRMYKFRSMVRDAHELRDEYAAHNAHADGPIFKIPDDPRITSVGRVLRRTSLDELPQLFNVLRGEMSLVGPRPPLPDEVVTYDARQLGRLAVKPGLTCIWQVSGRSDVGFDDWVEMDLEYIREWSLALDVVLLVKSVPAVLSGKGAY